MLFLLAAGAVAFAADLIRQRAMARDVAEALTGGDVTRAPAALRRYGCGGCHTIAGIAGADGKVGGRLSDLRQQVYIGGVVTNTPQNLTAWIVAPQLFSPTSAMPATGISEAEARDVAAYLYSH
jgi:cytochrome c2